MVDPVFGLKINQIDEESRPVIGADLSVAGFIGPAPGANPTTFPLNTPVLVYSYDTTKIDKLGTSGYLGDAIRAVNDQLGEMQFSAKCVIVRTAEGVDADSAIKLQKTINNIVGSSTGGTGIFAFLKSVSSLAVIPRLIAAPGYTSQLANSVDTISLDTGGDGYIEGESYTVTFSGGGSNAVQATGHALGQADNTLGDIVLDTPGAWYTSAPTVTAPSAGKRVTAAVIADGGSGYAEGDTVTLANGVVLSVDSVGTSPDGVITAVTVATPGLIGPTDDEPTNLVMQTATSGAGTGATFDLTWTAYTAATYTATYAEGGNPVCVSLTSVLNQLMAHAVVESAGISEEDDDDWRETISSKRLIPLSGGCKVLDPVTSNVVFRPIAPRAIGVGIRRDYEKGAPFHSWANQPIQGIVGLMRDIPYSLTDAANEAQSLLGNNIGVVVRGELGNEFALASGGFILIATDNAGEDELWRFYNMTRGRDFIHLSLLKTMRYYLGRYNIVPHTVQAILNAMKMLLRDLSADGHILGYRIAFNPDSNNADNIRAGKLTVGFKAEEAAPLRLLTIESARYREAVDAMILELANQLSLAA